MSSSVYGSFKVPEQESGEVPQGSCSDGFWELLDEIGEDGSGDSWGEGSRNDSGDGWGEGSGEYLL